MTNDIVINAETLGKKYVIGHQPEGARYVALRDVLMYKARGILSKTKALIHGRPIVSGHSLEDFWALRGVSFEVHRGEVVGVIGRNGAGKSTILKILSRITEPSEGRVTIKGRVASLLEVGTGFHPELSGRENIFLSGAVMGMTRREVFHKFDEIVAFAEIEQFIDTPVKRYSSGMYVRLGFAIAAHLQSDILLVDEVLAVGDAGFQSKCIGQIKGVAQHGRTVLFVSHQTPAIEALCSRCLLLVDGKLHSSGPPREITASYLGMAVGGGTGRCRLDTSARKRQAASAMMEEVSISRGDHRPVAGIPMRSSLAIHVRFRTWTPMHPVLGVVVKSAFGTPLFGINNRIASNRMLGETVAGGVITCHFDDIPLMPGTYHVDLYLGDWIADLDVIRDAISFEVLPIDVFGTGKLPSTSFNGPLLLPARWSLDAECRPSSVDCVGATSS